MKRSLPVMLIVGFTLALGTLTAEAQQETKKKEGQHRSRFVVAADEEGFVMVEQTSGRSWMLEYSADDEPVWLPVERIDDPAAAETWREKRDAEWQEAEEQEKREAGQRRQLEKQQQRLTELFRNVSEKYKQTRGELQQAFHELGEGSWQTRNLQNKIEVLDGALRELKDDLEAIAKQLDELPVAEGQRNDHDGIETADAKHSPSLEEPDEREKHPRTEAKLSEPAIAERHDHEPPEHRPVGDVRGRLTARLHDLEAKRDKQLETHGDDHPIVQLLNREIDRVKNELRDGAGRPGRPDRHGDEPFAHLHPLGPPGARDHLSPGPNFEQRIISRLQELTAHREKSIEQYGLDHPAVRSADQEIRGLKRALAELGERRGHHPEAQDNPSDSKDRDQGEAKNEQQRRKKRNAALLARWENARSAVQEAKQHSDDVVPRLDAESSKTLLKLLNAASRDIQQQIENVEKHLGSESATESQPDQPTSIDAMKRELFPLLLEEEMLLQSHGPLHPKVLEVRKKIELTKKYLESLQKQETER